MSRVLNYLGQLRLYSYADLMLLLWALGAKTIGIITCSLLWFGFLIHLEWRHRDIGRNRWPWFAWIIPWIFAVAIMPSLSQVLFFASAVAYSLKKRYKVLGLFSSIFNGGLKVLLLVIGVSSLINVIQIIGIFFVMTVRNILGDIRDSEKDAREGVCSLPVALRYQKSTPVVYPAALAASSLLWTIIGNLPIYALICAWLIEAATYRLTPR